MSAWQLWKCYRLQRYVRLSVCLSVISYHIVDLKRQNHLKVGTNKSQLKVKMQSVSDDDVRKRFLEKPRSFELAVKGAFRLGRCDIFCQGIPGLQDSNGKAWLPAYIDV